jgi:hypothetical protein
MYDSSNGFQYTSKEMKELKPEIGLLVDLVSRAFDVFSVSHQSPIHNGLLKPSTHQQLLCMTRHLILHSLHS